MEISQNGLDFIKSFEGYHTALRDGRCTTYYCPSGVLTIGYGSTNMDGGPRISPGDIWTREQAEQRLRESLARNYEPSVKKELAKSSLRVTQAQYDMLVSFTYNCGAGCLAQLMRRGSLQEIADALLLFVRGGGQVLPGLVRRRRDERRIFLEGYSVQAQAVEPVAKPAIPVIAAKQDQEAQKAARVILAEHSEKYSVVTSLMRWLGFGGGGLAVAKQANDIGVTDSLGIIQTIGEFVANHGLALSVIALAVGLLVLEYLRYRQADDLIKGRSVPSGLAQNETPAPEPVEDVAQV